MSHFNVPRLISAALSVVVCAALLLCSGCGKSRAASAQTPPPPTLSEPIRPMETAPATSPSIPAASNSEDYAAQRTGESRQLPAVTVALPPAKPAPAAAAAPKLGDGRYHTLAKGETVYAVSRIYGVKAKDIIQANNFRDPNRLSVGTKIYIP